MNNTVSPVIPFDFDGRAVRIITRDGEPWFVLSDVCKVLEHSNASVAASRLDEDERGVANVYTPSGEQQMTIISEAGLYSLVLTSRKPEAKRFKKWITGEVLPTLRKTGSYGQPAPALSREQRLAAALLDSQEIMAELDAKVSILKDENATLRVDSAALDRIATANGSLCIRDAAKALQVQPKSFSGFLLEYRWIYRRADRAPYLGHEAKVRTGLLEHKVTTVRRSDGSEKIVEQVRVTPKGLTKLAELLNKPPMVLN